MPRQRIVQSSYEHHLLAGERTPCEFLYLRFHLSCDNQVPWPIGLRLDSLTAGFDPAAYSITLLGDSPPTLVSCNTRRRFFSSLIITIRLLAADGSVNTMGHLSLDWTWV